MGNAVIKISLVSWRDGRPRFSPGPKQRRMGYVGEDLRHGPTGPWFSVEECLAWSKARVAEIEAKSRAIAEGATTMRKTAKATARARADGIITVGQLLEDFLALPQFKGENEVLGKRTRKPKSKNTVRYYEGASKTVERLDGGRVWNEAAAAVTPKALTGIFDRIEVKHGLAQTRAVRALLSVAYGWGMKHRGLRANPATGIDLPTLAPRVRVAEPEELAALVDVARRIGRHDMALSITLGPWTGQRQADRLSLTDGQVTPDGIRFRQAKKGGAPLLIPLTQAVVSELADARDRRREWRVNYPHVVLDEKARRPFEADWYRKVFRVIRSVAATGKHPKTKDANSVLRDIDLAAALEGFKPVATVADLRDQDLRDTAVTWLSASGCNKWEIAAITGHELGSIDNVLRHYFGPNPELARSAMEKLQAWFNGRRPLA